MQQLRASVAHESKASTQAMRAHIKDQVPLLDLVERGLGYDDICAILRARGVLRSYPRAHIRALVMARTT